MYCQKYFNSYNYFFLLLDNIIIKYYTENQRDREDLLKIGEDIKYLVIFLLTKNGFLH